jgi:hypothetical protein
VRANLLPATPVAFAVRPFYPVDQALDAMGAGGLRRVVYRLASLPANYLLELGFFAIAAAVYWWRRRLAAHAGRPLGRGELGVLVMAGAALLVASFVKSAIRSNDLGWRSMMFVQFAALLWAADVVPLLARAGAAPRLRAPLRAVLAGALLLGVVAVAYDLAAMKLYPVGRVAGARLFDRQPWSASDYGRQMHDVRSAYAWIDRALPPAALVQPNPAYRGEALYSHIAIDVFQGLYGTRATPAGDPEYGTLYGVPRAMYDSVAAPAVLAFASRDAAAAASLCRGGGVAALLVKSTDPAWQDRASWVWRARAAYANESARVVPCASLTGAAPISAAGR